MSFSGPGPYCTTLGTLRSGEPLEDAVSAVSHCENIEAMLINCSFHTSIVAALPRLRKAAPAGVVLGAYANGFNTKKGGVKSTEFCCGEDDKTNGAAEYEEVRHDARCSILGSPLCLSLRLSVAL